MGFFVVYDVKCVTHFGKLILTLPFNSCLRCQEVIQLWTNFAAQVLASHKYILHFLFVLRSFGWPEVKVPSKIFMFSLYSELNIMERYFYFFYTFTTKGMINDYIGFERANKF